MALQQYRKTIPCLQKNLTTFVATGEHAIYISISFYTTPIRDLTASKKKKRKQQHPLSSLLPSLSDSLSAYQLLSFLFSFLLSLLIYSAAVVAFQIIFCTKIHVNDFFHFLKIIFNISTLKRSKTY
jgi:hypothetical protein